MEGHTHVNNVLPRANSCPLCPCLSAIKRDPRTIDLINHAAFIASLIWTKAIALTPIAREVMVRNLRIGSIRFQRDSEQTRELVTHLLRLNSRDAMVSCSVRTHRSRQKGRRSRSRRRSIFPAVPDDTRLHRGSQSQVSSSRVWEG